MKAWVLNGIGDIRLQDVEKPEPADGEVLVRVQAAGICGSDIPRIYQTGAYHHPLIPGHEFAGIVEQEGAASGAQWVGKRVGIFPLIPCGACLPCSRKTYEMCQNYSYLGSRRDGGFAEYVAVPENNLIELPADVSIEAAAMLEPMAVAVHAIRRVAPRPDDVVAVCGLGAIGLFLVMFLKEMGVEKIVAIGNKELQKQKAMQLGISETEYFDTRYGNVAEWLTECTKGAGADVFFECVGKKETISLAVDHASPAGRVCVVGNPYSDITLEKPVYWKILRNQLTVTGTWNSSFLHEPSDDWHYVIDCLAGKKIHSDTFVTHSFSLDQLDSGFHIMRDKVDDYVKILAQIVDNV